MGAHCFRPKFISAAVQQCAMCVARVFVMRYKAADVSAAKTVPRCALCLYRRVHDQTVCVKQKIIHINAIIDGHAYNIIKSHFNESTAVIPIEYRLYIIIYYYSPGLSIIRRVVPNLRTLYFIHSCT